MNNHFVNCKCKYLLLFHHVSTQRKLMMVLAHAMEHQEVTSISWKLLLLRLLIIQRRNKNQQLAKTKILKREDTKRKKETDKGHCNATLSTINEVYIIMIQSYDISN